MQPLMFVPKEMALALRMASRPEGRQRLALAGALPLVPSTLASLLWIGLGAPKAIRHLLHGLFEEPPQSCP